MCFPPKGQELEDEREIRRAAEQTRPLSLKNTDSKLIASGQVSVQRDTHMAWTVRNRGFVPGRQLALNVVEADACLRAVAWAQHLLPIAICFDFAAASPSISQRFLMLLLEVMQADEGFRNIVQSLYSSAFAFAMRPVQLLFLVLAGVAQGCPLSGMLFDWVLQPFLCHLARLMLQ